MLRIVEIIIGLQLCEQSCADQAALCQGKAHGAAERARYQGKNYTPHDLSTPPSEIMKIRPCLEQSTSLFIVHSTWDRVRSVASFLNLGVQPERYAFNLTMIQSHYQGLIYKFLGRGLEK